MANPFEVLKARVAVTNDLLKSEKVGATIYIRKDGFALRAVLPSKADPKSPTKTQQWVSLNLKAEAKNIKEAVRLAKKLGKQKKAGLFRWDDWDKKEESTVEPIKESRKVRDIIKRFEKHFWNQPDKDKTNKTQQSGWTAIKVYLDKMEGHKILNYENIVELADTAPSGSKKKADIAKHFLRLAKFAEMPNLKKLSEWSIATQQAYKKSAKKRSRKRLADEQYLEIIEGLRDDPIWGWAIAAQFVFGARTSEIWSIKPFEEDGEILAEILTVSKSEEPTEDDWRITPALQQEWARSLNILDVQKEFVIDKATDYDPEKLKPNNRRFTKWLARKTNAAFQAYDLRHAYGYRTANLNINTSSASKWMGHSEAVHTDTYQKGYDKGDALQSLKLLRQQQK